jgi:hypothetical protein
LTGRIQKASGRRVAVALGAQAAVVVAAAFFFAFVLPQTPGRLERPAARLFDELALWRWATGGALPVPAGSGTVAALLAGVTVAAFAAYALALRTASRAAGRGALALVLGVTVLAAVVTTLSLPTSTSDIFNYMMRGRIAAVHGGNPYYRIADEYPTDPYYAFANRQYTGGPEDKLPAWSLLNGGLARQTDDRVVRGLMLYRGTFFALLLGTVALVVAALHRLHPAGLVQGIVFFGWNPIVVLFGSCKTDTLMIVFFMLAVVLLAYGRRRWSYGPMAVSMLVKPFTLPLLAVQLGRALRVGRRREVALGVAIVVAVAVAAYAPFWQGRDLLLRHAGSVDRAAATGRDLLRPLFLLGFGALGLGLAVRRDDTVAGLLRAWALLLLWFGLFLTHLGFAWYLMVLIALLAVVPDGRLRALGVLLSLGSLLLNLWDSTFTADFSVPEVLGVPRLFVYLAVPALAATALLAVAGWQRYRRGGLV